MPQVEITGAARPQIAPSMPPFCPRRARCGAAAPAPERAHTARLMPQFIATLDAFNVERSRYVAAECAT